jgi:hypothetical protein
VGHSRKGRFFCGVEKWFFDFLYKDFKLEKSTSTTKLQKVPKNAKK